MSTLAIAPVVTASGHLLPLADEAKKSGPIGLAVILALCVVCYFLFKSLSRHLRKVREEFPQGREGGPTEPVAPADSTVPPGDQNAGTPAPDERDT